MNDINAIQTRTVVKLLAITAGFIGAIYLAYLVRQQLAWFGVAFFLAIALNPAVERLSKQMPRKSRGLAAGLVFLITIALFVFMVVTLLPPLLGQTQGLIQSIPNITNEIVQGDNPLSEFLRDYDLVPRLQANQEQISAAISDVGGSVLDVLNMILTSVVATLTILVTTFFMLIEGPKWIELLKKNIAPHKLAHREKLATQMYRTVTGYVNGNLFTSLIAAVITAVFLSLIGVPYAIPLGILLGLFDLLPLVGATIGSAIIIAVGLFVSVPTAIAITIFCIVYQQFENNILQPLVYAKTVEISPLTVLVAALIGASLGGIMGALVAIPIVASALILVKDYLQNHRTAK